MPAAETRVATTRADRYLAQLSDHLGRMQHRHPGSHAPTVQQVERSDHRAVITFDWGRCTLTAAADALSIRAEASDDDALSRGQGLISRRIETIGRREHLTVTWQRLGD